MPMLRVVIIVQILFFSGFACAQEKVEIERRISPKVVPDSAKRFVCKMFPKARVRWILEKSGTDEKFEAKVKLGRERMSVEFSRDGEFEDVESTIHFDKLARAISENIRSQLDHDFDRYRIVKVQHHYSGDKEQINRFFHDGEADFSAVLQFYEILVYGIIENRIGSYVYDFSTEGKLVSRVKNSDQNTDNLVF